MYGEEDEDPTRVGSEESKAMRRRASEQRCADIVGNCQVANSNLAQLLEEEILGRRREGVYLYTREAV